MSHKLDPILDAGLHPEASFSKSRSGEKWGYIDVFKHELGLSKCIFETAEEALDFKKRQVMAAEGPVQLTRSGKAVEAKPVSKERGDA